MAHDSSRNFCIEVRQKFPDFFQGKKVLDIGSLDINGNNRYLFKDCDYTGLDVADGKNVDVVSIAHEFNGPDNSFDVIMSTEVFEHDMFWKKSLLNITRMLKPGGLFFFTCAGPNRAEHGTRRSDGSYAAPLLLQISEEWSDYYGNLYVDDISHYDEFISQYEDGWFVGYGVDTVTLIELHDLFFCGIKK
jgi:SAM-dependent methyltransferase